MTIDAPDTRMPSRTPRTLGGSEESATTPTAPRRHPGAVGRVAIDDNFGAIDA